ncbi:hypothetical protein JYA63_09165 [Fictibacillus nanhaiensis]|uniref:Transposase DDE domain-containing protein n=1 Tax=Fictibacillus nanhaiensis TaxID=742169 RepID=A0ABS2ZQB7_9BACL|nr:hypothetical protein [Fictibacillus nanhaiensis]
MIKGGEKTYSGETGRVSRETSSSIGETRSFTGERVRNIITRTVKISLTVSVKHDLKLFLMKNIFNIAKSTIFAKKMIYLKRLHHRENLTNLILYFEGIRG